MFKHVSHVFLYEVRRNFRRRGYIFTTFGVPLIAFVVFFGYQFINNRNANNNQASPGSSGSSASQVITSAGDFFRNAGQVGYVDLSGRFDDPGALRNRFTRFDDEAAAEAALDAGKISLYYVIAADYLSTGDVTLVTPRLNLGQTSDAPVRRLVLQELSEGIDSDVFNRLVDPMRIREINLQRDSSGRTQSNFGTDFAVAYLFAILLMLAVFTTNGYMMQTVIEEKETRLIEILISSMRPTQLLAGKILALGFLGFLQIVVWLVAIVWLGRLAAGSGLTAVMALISLNLTPFQVLLFLLYFVFGYLFFAAAYGIVGAISTSMQEGPQFAVFFTLPAAIPLYFIGLFTTSPDAPLPVILSLIPVTAPLSMVMRISITTVPAWQILLSLALLIALDMVMIWLAGRVFRVQTLLAGQAPKLRDITRLLRG
ncbi:MAG: ABC transporter permease [Chloroflexi bacterium]|nr:ABC transporter permease [Chloroflexota bacterium]